MKDDGGYRVSEPSRYRMLDLVTWELIQAQDGDAIKLFLYYWFGPVSTAFGILRVPDGYVAADLGWNPARIARVRALLEAADLLWRDRDLTVLVPFLKSNAPPNGKVVTNWTRQLAALPDSPLYGRLYHRAAEWLTAAGLAFLLPKMKPAPDTVSHTVSDTVSTQDAGCRGQDAGVRDPEEIHREAGASPDAAQDVLAYLNQKAKRNYRPVEANLQLIQARMKDGIGPKQLMQIIDCKVREWRGTDQEKYLRPATLFAKVKAEQYFGQLGADRPAEIRYPKLGAPEGHREDSNGNGSGAFVWITPKGRRLSAEEFIREGVAERFCEDELARAAGWTLEEFRTKRLELGL